jgi:hypothetical protein
MLEFLCLSIRVWSYDCGFSKQETSKYVYECFKYGKVYYSNSIIVINFMQSLISYFGIEVF